MENEPPHTVFLIPYRDRAEEAKYFMAYFEHYVKKQPNMDSGAIFFFCHQSDTRPFNRGAMKNLGFLTIKELYPETWKDITLVFHDVDCYPQKHVKLPYTTEKGTVTHYYGFKQTLGGIVVINAEDFDNIGGYPNFWGWGYEDNTLALRVVENNINIDRDLFYDVHDDSNFTRLDQKDEKKIVSKNDTITFKNAEFDTFNDIKNISKNVDKNKNVIHFFHFTSKLPCPQHSEMQIFDLRDGQPDLVNYLHRRGTFRSGRRWGLS